MRYPAKETAAKHDRIVKEASRLFRERGFENVTVGEVMARVIPQLETTVHLDEAYRLLLAGNTGVLAVNDGKVVDIITRIDLIHYWNETRQK